MAPILVHSAHWTASCAAAEPLDMAAGQHDRWTAWPLDIPINMAAGQHLAQRPSHPPHILTPRMTPTKQPAGTVHSRREGDSAFNECVFLSCVSLSFFHLFLILFFSLLICSFLSFSFCLFCFFIYYCYLFILFFRKLFFSPSKSFL